MLGRAFAILGLLASTLAAQSSPIRVAVLEFRDQWTKGALGARALLEKTGAKVHEFDVDRPATEQQADLIVFGSFVDNMDPYRDWVAIHGSSIAPFLAGGGVVVQMAQTEEIEPVVPWLPKGCRVRRNDDDTRSVRIVGPADHPLLAWAPVQLREGGRWIDYTPPVREPLSADGLTEVEGVQVLAAGKGAHRPPVLVVGQHGRGRFVITSLQIDKVFTWENRPRVPAKDLDTSERFFRRLVTYAELVKEGNAPPVVPTRRPAVGPMIGHLDETSAHIWFRPQGPGTYKLQVRSDAQVLMFEADAEATDATDQTVQWKATGLEPNTFYDYAISGGDGGSEVKGQFRTAPERDSKVSVRLAIGSSGDTEDIPLWSRMLEFDVNAIVLLGNTPYIDSVSLDVARRKHRRFLLVPGLASLIKSIPLWSTWDDHDFGKDGTDGNLQGKRYTRQAFLEYRAQEQFGQDGRGIYTSFRYGPIEVFLLDTRWFAGTSGSPADSTAPTAIGRRQWTWLTRKLRTSTTPFKVIASGMSWRDKKNTETDDWETYRVERDALFEYIRFNEIPGCVFAAGDVNVSRHLVHGKDALGYEMHEFVTSPLSSDVTPELNVNDPGLEWSSVEPHVFLVLEADSRPKDPLLTATWVQQDGRRLHEVELPLSKLSR